MDKAHLSRIVARFAPAGSQRAASAPTTASIGCSPSPKLAGKPTPRPRPAPGRRSTPSWRRSAEAGASGWSRPCAISARRSAAREAEAGDLRLRPLRPGDIGWIIHRQAIVYAQEYDWDWTYEGLASSILGAFVAEFDPSREDGWVAERGGAIVGSVFLMKSDDPGGRETQTALCRAQRARGRPWAHAGRDLHRSRARARLSSADAMDQRRADRGAAHLSDGGV